jgi:hypothetical protein
MVEDCSPSPPAAETSPPRFTRFKLIPKNAYIGILFHENSEEPVADFSHLSSKGVKAGIVSDHLPFFGNQPQRADALQLPDLDWNGKN